MLDTSPLKRHWARALFVALVASLTATAILGATPAYCGSCSDKSKCSDEPPPPPSSPDGK